MLSTNDKRERPPDDTSYIKHAQQTQRTLNLFITMIMCETFIGSVYFPKRDIFVTLCTFT